MKVWTFKIQDHVWQYSPLLKREQQSTDSLEPGTTAIYTHSCNLEQEQQTEMLILYLDVGQQTQWICVAGEGGRSVQEDSTVWVLCEFIVIINSSIIISFISTGHVHCD